MHPKLRIRLIQALLGVALGLGAAVLWLQGRRPEAPMGASAGGHFLPSPFPAPPFSLTSHEGTRVSSGDFRGKLLLVFFGYTSCPDVCPLTLSNLTRTFTQMNEDGGRIQVFLITVDPSRDTPERLRDYLSNFHPSFLGLTGTEEEIRSVADGFGVYFSKTRGGENYTVDHTARVFVVDPAGRVPLTFPVTAQPEEMTRDLGLLVKVPRG